MMRLLAMEWEINQGRTVVSTTIEGISLRISSAMVVNHG